MAVIPRSERSKCVLLSGIVDKVVKILTFGARAFETSGEAFVFLRWRRAERGLLVRFYGFIDWMGGWKWFN